MAMMPHGRSLVEKLKNKPFAIVGVNFDNSPDALKQVEERNKISWRSFWAGADNDIGQRYNVRYLPTILVLDHKGRIRYKGPRGNELDAAVETLLKEVP